MRILILAAFLATPAIAQEGYDATLLPACLDAAGNGDASQCIGKSSTACMDAPGGSSTMGMGQCLTSETTQWDGLLNEYYTKAIAQAKDADTGIEGTSIEKSAPILQQAQRNWIGFRDASCKYQAVRYQGGSMGSTAYANCMMAMTADQALNLRLIAEPQG